MHFRTGTGCVDKRLLHDGVESLKAKIVEASAEHDFCFKRLNGMSRASECVNPSCPCSEVHISEPHFLYFHYSYFYREKGYRL